MMNAHISPRLKAVARGSRKIASGLVKYLLSELDPSVKHTKARGSKEHSAAFQAFQPT